MVEFQDSHSAFDQVRSCAHFQIDERFLDPQLANSETKLFRDTAAVDILRRIAAGLRQKGYKVSDPKPGKACDAALEWSSQITVVLNVAERMGGVAKCALLTYRSRSLSNCLFNRNNARDAECTEQWERFCLAIDQQLRESLRADSVTWLTRKEAEFLWSE